MEDIAFPRGGRFQHARDASDEANDKEQLKKSAFRKRKQQTDATETKPSSDFLFGGTKEKKTDPSAKKRKKEEDTSTGGSRSLLPLGGGGVVAPSKSKGKSTTPIIEALGFAKLSKGTKLLGCVREVQDEFAVVSLPNQLTGYVLREDVSKAFGGTKERTISSLKQCFSVGQVLGVVVQKVATEKLAGGEVKRRIQLSASPLYMNPRQSLTASNDSTASSLLLRGQIVSVEDHGCVVDLGLGRNGFLKFDNVQDSKFVILEADEEPSDDVSSTSTILQPGRFLDFQIIPEKKVTEGKSKSKSYDAAPSVVQLKLPNKASLVGQMVLPPASKHTTPHTLNSLQPGMMVTTKVEAVAKNGLCVAFLANVFRGSIEVGVHLGGHFFDEQWKQLFQKHQHFPARIVAIDAGTKLIRLSIAPHVLQLQPAPQFAKGAGDETTGVPPVGTILENCTVVKVDAGIGALLALPKEYYAKGTLLPKSLANKTDLFRNESFQEAMSIPGVYVHISKAYDDESKKSKKAFKDRENNTGRFAKDFPLGSTHSVRILSKGHWMDGVATAGCSPSILKAHVLTHSDLEPGQVFKQVPVYANLPGGSVLVNLGGSAENPVRGLIPGPMHLTDSSSGNNSDFRKKVLETKFTVDAKVDVRVLWVDQYKKKCVLTAKKSFVKVDDESQVVSSYEDLEMGQTVVGFVSKLDDRALFVTFCNKVYGKVTAKSLASELGIENHKANYKVGDVVKCRVVKISEKIPSVGLDDEEMDDDDETDDIETKKAKPYYQVLLSLSVGDSGDDANEEQKLSGDAKPHQVAIQAGAILPPKAMKIVELVRGKPRSNGDGFVPGYAVVSIKSKYLVDENELPKMQAQMECKLPFDQLLDEYNPDDLDSADALDAIASKLLQVGKKINQKALVLTDPHKTNVDHASGVGRLTVVSLRKSLIKAMEAQSTGENSRSTDVRLPNPKSDLFVGSLVTGFVAQIDKRHGAFIRFLDGLTGFVPRSSGGLQLQKYSTIVTKVRVLDDTVKPFKIMLEPLTIPTDESKEAPVKVGDSIPRATVTKVQPLFATLDVEDNVTKAHRNIRYQLHASMKEVSDSSIQFRKKPLKPSQIVTGHPFYEMEVHDVLTNLKVVSVSKRKGSTIVQLSDRVESPDNGDTDVNPPTFVTDRSQLRSGMTVEAVISKVGHNNNGLEALVSPTVKGYIPSLEVSKDVRILNDLDAHVPIGCKVKCVVMDNALWHENRAKSPFASESQQSWLNDEASHDDDKTLFLSILAVEEPSLAVEKPERNDLVVGRVNKALPQSHAPSLMLSLRGGFLARCCITELVENDEWENMPLGRIGEVVSKGSKTVGTESAATMEDDSDDDSDDSATSADSGDDDEDQLFPNGMHVVCRVLRSVPKQSMVEVSLRESRIEGDIDDDEPMPEGETVQGFVIQTNKKGCFIRLARHIEGRVTLKELSEAFLPNPAVSFPPGRLVTAKVKSIQEVKKSKSSKDPTKFRVDLDMRESSLLDKKKLMSFDDIELQSKHKGTVTRIESYGVFVQLENSNVSGLVHMSECSDHFIKNLQALYNPGDLVKVLVIKKDPEEKKLGLSMKASHFENDEDSDDDTSMEGEVEDDDEDSEMEDVFNSGRMQDDDDLDSDDENYVSKLASKMETEEDSEDDSDEADSSEDDSDDEGPAGRNLLDSDVGFQWGVGTAIDKRNGNDSSDESDSEEESDDEDGKKSSHKSRKKQAERRREEQEISRREVALADGTADENPETPADFERLLAGDPNSSELWIRYMAFYLSLADVAKARAVAEKALERIEFRQEQEKLNVWTALLTLEHKYGDEDSLQKAIDRACGQNSPKQVYLRVCEILEKDLSTPQAVAQADAMHERMRRKFKSKKKVWLASLQYLLKLSRHAEAHALLKRGLLSLASHKHAETMTKFAQLEYEFGSAERARTLFSGLFSKYPKRLDLFFVCLDKEVKFGSIKSARSLLEEKVKEAKLSDKQMKKLFKKWYRIEEQHGTAETLELVKESARAYVQTTTN
eukprot:Nitzschia sp. Nitz4//scaffold29_size155292//140902//147146//NITZ4_002690-RA/size155292-augustus-gene-0.216-mRNA-1//1//CDS//3329546544//3529//frame0